MSERESNAERFARIQKYCDERDMAYPAELVEHLAATVELRKARHTSVKTYTVEQVRAALGAVMKSFGDVAKIEAVLDHLRRAS